MISVYTDGSSGAGGGKPGGWAYVIVRDEKEVLIADYGGDPSTTNNIMELSAAIFGLIRLNELVTQGVVRADEVLELVSDSQYTLGIVSGGYTPTKNLELAQHAKAIAALFGERLRYRWVRGHSGNQWNERADSLAGKGKREHTPPAILAKQEERKRKKRKIRAQSPK